MINATNWTTSLYAQLEQAGEWQSIERILGNSDAFGTEQSVAALAKVRFLSLIVYSHAGSRNANGYDANVLIAHQDC